MTDHQAPYQRPRYALSSVDHVLRIIQLLRDTGGARLSDVARELQISPSAAHRLLSMLVYRDFAAQDATRTYIPGPSLGIGPTSSPWTRTLKSLVAPHLELLAERLDETVSLMFRTGTRTRVILSIEGTQPLRVGDRMGLVQDARRTSGGKAILAEHDRSLLERLYRSQSSQLAGTHMSELDFVRFLSALEEVRQRGYALNRDETEAGLHALGMSLQSASGSVLAAFALCVPASRGASLETETTLALMRAARDEMNAEIRASAFRFEP
ncbi:MULTISPECIES: IclR family transcriptional regulator C-terminal domain-containing protein [unclassified Salinibacterium]|uniref:IclR family transcriptional regulator n=1 Tax=unclassified Salinibacterium TaxID=2632331 RepID=UPI00141EA398|nr:MULTISPECIES: IclR family transcriptional regulator C-terminal domain-containing protein [unclassified Salinibacterium]